MCMFGCFCMLLSRENLNNLQDFTNRVENDCYILAVGTQQEPLGWLNTFTQRVNQHGSDNHDYLVVFVHTEYFIPYFTI